MYGRLILTAALVLAALGLTSTAGANPVLERFHTTIDMNGAVLTCSSEDVVFSGTGTESGIFVLTPSSVRAIHLTFNLSGVTAVGLTTGTHYRVNGVTTTTSTFAAPEPRADANSWIQTWLLVPEGGGRPLSFHEVMITVFDASGNLVSLVWRQPRDCI
jgi:hypothetical protein